MTRGARLCDNEINIDGFGDVLQVLGAKRLESDIRLVPKLVVNRIGDDDAPRRRKRFQARGDIDAVAEYIAVFQDDVADIQTHPQDNLFARFFRRVVKTHCRLDGHGTVERIDRAREFREEPVARGLENATPVFGDIRIDDGRANKPEIVERPLFVFLHLPAETDHVGGDDCGEATFHVRCTFVFAGNGNIRHFDCTSMSDASPY